MAGIHGKNATIRVSTTETLISGGIGATGAMTGTQGGSFAVGAAYRNWRYERETILVQFKNTAGAQGHPDDVDTSINTQTRLINYAGGAIHLGQYPLVVSGVYALAKSMTLTTVANLVSDARSWSCTVNNDAIDSTVIGETWRTFEDGIAGFEGTLDGLWVDNFWYKKAVATLSGLIPRTVLRLAADPKDATSYYQGTVIFPTWEMSGGYDGLVEYSVPFQGRGPLDLIEAGAPFFKVHETT